MNAHLVELAARRTALSERSGVLRDSLAHDAGALGRRFRTADRLVAAARSGPARALLLGAAVFLVVGRPRRVLALALRGLALWPLISTLLPRVRALFGEPKASA